MKYKGEPTEGQKARALFADALKSIECQCGRQKAPKRAVCFKCWGKLTPEMRRSLYLKIGAGGSQAYVAAYLYLNSPASEDDSPIGGVGQEPRNGEYCR